MSKRKHVTLPIKKKLQILKALDEGECVTQLAMQYGVGKSTICDIKKKRCSINQYLTNADNETPQRETLKLCKHPEMEHALFICILQERARHTPLNGELICEKAKWFYQKLTGKDDFNASSGWLHKFKKRHGIRQLQITGEKLSADKSAVEPFRQKFLDKIKQMNLVPDQVYNADESGLFYRVLPNKTLAH
ncbi:hypothetical protein Zmor_003854 [Zophobas morio]|uniref:HTH CENPB-type domain-containing protein n=1 Tax=Zophobas morio TaxID=2755281 RepID=A0AA38HMU3_9CUCU|nr:hypothetical protein Zmor_003854 [Zophobas morio]